MNPPPIALGLTLCEKVIIEEGTRSTTLVSTFTKLSITEVGTPAQRFALVATLVSGRGEGVIDLVIVNVETEEEAYSLQTRVHFPDPLAEVRLVYNVRDCSFPAPGCYEAILLVDGDWVTRRKFLVELTEEQL